MAVCQGEKVIYFYFLTERPELVPFDRMAPADELTSTVATIFTSILLDTSTVESM